MTVLAIIKPTLMDYHFDSYDEQSKDTKLAFVNLFI